MQVRKLRTFYAFKETLEFGPFLNIIVDKVSIVKILSSILTNQHDVKYKVTSAIY